MEEEDMKDYYATLGIDQSASQTEIKRAFRRIALRLHPDRLFNLSEAKRAEATRRFQRITRIAEVLSDPEKRRLYDLGVRDDAELDSASQTPTGGPTFGMDDIDHFAQKYRGSQEEVDDVLDTWHRFVQKVNPWKYVLAHVPFAEEGDLARFRAILRKANVSDKPLGEKKEADSEDSSIEDDFQEHDLDSDSPSGSSNSSSSTGLSSGLMSMAAREERRKWDLIEHLKRKYAPSNKNSYRAKRQRTNGAIIEAGKMDWSREPGEPTEAEFQAARKRIDAARRRHTASRI